jgi:site-specific DNA-methyltransferase (adenine-specific)
MSRPYYQDDTVTLYHGDALELLPCIAEEEYAPKVDLIVADPPYGETALAWDHWPAGWLRLASHVANSLWCFGSFGMFLDHRDEFWDYWRLAQDIVWEKHNGSGFTRDRFRKVHEFGLHWYRGPWREIHHEVPREPRIGRNQGTRRIGSTGEHLGARAHTAWIDDGSRIARSVIFANSMQGRAIHPTEKPVSVLRPLIEYGCPPGGLVLDPFAGSGSTLDAARQIGRKAIGIEAREDYCEAAALRLSELVFPPDEEASAS